MDIKYKIIIPLSVLALIAAGCGKSSSPSTSQNNTSTTNATTTEAGTKLSDEPYAQYAYLIDPTNLSANAKLALTGFNMTEQSLTNGDTQITLTALRTGYQTQIADLASGDQLYFIEKNLKDDNGTDNDDGTYLDDSAVVVDANGYVIQTTVPSPENSASSTPSSASSSQPSAMPTQADNNGSVLLKTNSSSSLGAYLSGPNGMTLYTFANDTSGVSNCNGQCAAAWPPFAATTVAANLATTNPGLSVIKRADGTMQYAYKGRPLYYFAQDSKPGDTTGNGVGGVWLVAKP